MLVGSTATLQSQRVPRCSASLGSASRKLPLQHAQSYRRLETELGMPGVADLRPLGWQCCCPGLHLRTALVGIGHSLREACSRVGLLICSSWLAWVLALRSRLRIGYLNGHSVAAGCGGCTCYSVRFEIMQGSCMISTTVGVALRPFGTMQLDRFGHVAGPRGRLFLLKEPSAGPAGEQRCPPQQQLWGAREERQTSCGNL